MLAMLGTRLTTLPRTLPEWNIPMEEAVLEIMGTISPRVSLSRDMLGQWDTGQPTRTRTKRSVSLDYSVIEYVAYFLLHNQSLGDKIIGVKEQLVGKITNNPELVQVSPPPPVGFSRLTRVCRRVMIERSEVPKIMSKIMYFTPSLPPTTVHLYCVLPGIQPLHHG